MNNSDEEAKKMDRVFDVSLVALRVCYTWNDASLRYEVEMSELCGCMRSNFAGLLEMKDREAFDKKPLSISYSTLLLLRLLKATK